MNEDALKDAYALFRSDGYGDSIEDFKLLISQNEDALKDAYALFRSDGYGDSIEDFKLLIGVKKKDDSEPVGDTEGTTASTTEQAPASPTSSDSQQSDPISERGIGFEKPEPEGVPIPLRPEDPPLGLASIDELGGEYDPFFRNPVPIPLRPEEEIEFQKPSTFDPDPSKFFMPEYDVIDATATSRAKQEFEEKTLQAMERRFNRAVDAGLIGDNSDYGKMFPNALRDVFDEIQAEKRFVTNYDNLDEKMKGLISSGVIVENGEVVGIDYDLIPKENVAEILTYYEDSDSITESFFDKSTQSVAGLLSVKAKEEYKIKEKHASFLLEELKNNQIALDLLYKESPSGPLREGMFIKDPLLQKEAELLVKENNETLVQLQNMKRELAEDSIMVNALDLIAKNTNLKGGVSTVSTAIGTGFGYFLSLPQNLHSRSTIVGFRDMAKRNKWMKENPFVLPEGVEPNSYEAGQLFKDYEERAKRETPDQEQEKLMKASLENFKMAKETMPTDYRDSNYNFAGEVLGQLGFQLTVARVGGATGIPLGASIASIGAGYSMSSMEMYGDATESGLDHYDAMKLADQYATISAPLEMLPVSKTINKAIFKSSLDATRKEAIDVILKKGLKGFTEEVASKEVALSLKPLFKSAGVEFLEEGGQEALQYNIGLGLAKIYNANKTDSQKEFVKEDFGSSEYWKNLRQNFLLGGAAGGLIGGTTSILGGEFVVGSNYDALEEMFLDPKQMSKINDQLTAYRRLGKIKTDEDLQVAREQVGIIASAAAEVMNATKATPETSNAPMKRKLFELTSERLSLQKEVDGVKTLSLVSGKKQRVAEIDKTIEDLVSGKVSIDQLLGTEAAPVAPVVEETVAPMPAAPVAPVIEAAPVVEAAPVADEAMSKKVDNVFAEKNPDKVEILSGNLARNKSTEFELSSIGQSIVDQATKAATAIQRVAPNVRVVLHDTTKEYADFGKEGSRGMYDIGSKTIHIDLSKANKNTIGHETFHSILFNTIGTEKDIQAATDDMYKSVKRSLATSPLMKRKLRKFSEKYGENIQSEEALSELFGMLSSDYKQLNAPTKVKIKQFINKIASKFGLGDIIKLSEQDLSDIETIDLLNTMAARVKEGEAITEEDVETLDNGTNPIGTPTEINLPSERKQIEFKESYENSLVTPDKSFDFYKLLEDISSKKHKVWFWVADQLGINEEMGIDGGPSFAHQKPNDIWASSMPLKRIQDNIEKTNYIFIISGSPTVSKLFNKTAYDYITSKLGDFNNFKTKALETKPSKVIRETLEKYNSWEELRESTDRKPFLIALNNSQSTVNTAFTKYVNSINGYTDLGSLRDGFYKENNFGQNDIMLVLKPTGAREGSNHSTYSNTIEGEVIGVPDIKVDAFEIMPEEMRKKYEGKGKAQQSSVVAPYGSGVRDVTTPTTREQRIEDAKTPGTQIVTTVKEILFKGMQPKTKEGKPFSVHTIKKGSFAAVDKALASDYKGDKPLKQFTIPEGTTVDVVKVGDTNQGVTKVRRLEEELIDNSDAQIVKLITQDARGYSEQYIIKDDSILESGVDVVEEITKTIKKKDERKEKIAEGNKLFNKKQLQDATKIANRISERTGINYKDAERISKLDKERAKKISDAYEKAKSEPEKREVKEAYSALIDETILQYEEILLDGYTVEVSSNEYSNSGEMIDDLIENKNMRIFSTESGFGAEGITDAARKSNPMLKKTKFKDKNGVPLLVNDVFRFVHDFFGHAKMGNGFGPLGEENAWNVHSRMYSPLARRAMTTETRGQNSWVNFSGINEKAFKIRDEARALRKKAQSSYDKKDAIALLREAERKINQVYDMMDFAEQKVALLPEEFTKTDDEISTETTRDVREQKDDEIPQKTKNRIDGIIKRAKSKAKYTDPNVILKKVVANVQSQDKWYEGANDTQRENTVRYIREVLGLKEKATPFSKIFTLITDITKIDLKEQIDIAKSLKQRAKLTAKEKKVLDDSLNETLKELQGQGKLTTNQVKNVIKKFQKVDVFSQAQVDDFVDYMTKVFADADYMSKMATAKNKIPRARRNIKSKTGMNPIGPLLDRLFRINHRIIPSQFLDSYLDILDTMSKNKSELDFSELDSISKNTQEILNYMDGEGSKIYWLSSGYQDYINENKSKVRNKTFNEILDLMKTDEIIDDNDIAIMKKYKTTISPSERAKKTEAEIQEEKDSLIKDIKLKSKEKNPMFSTNDQKLFADKLKRLVKTKAIDELSLNELKTLLQALTNVNQGLVSSNVALFNTKLDSISNSKIASNSVAKATLGLVTKAYNKVKEKLSSKNYVQKALESSPLYYIDLVFGDGKSRALFDSIFKKIAEAEQNFNYDLTKIRKKYTKASDAVLKSLKGNNNKFNKSSAKQMLYMLQLEYLSNPNKNMFSALEYLDETIKLSSKLSKGDLEMLKEIRKEFAEDFNEDIDKLYSSFSKAEKESIKSIQEINLSLSENAAFTAGVIRGNRIELLNNYVHHVVVSDKFDGKKIDDDQSLMTNFNDSLKPSTKAKSLIERKNALTPLNFDIYNSVNRGSKTTLIDYHLTIPIKTARMTMKLTKKELESNGLYDGKKEIYEGLESLVENTITTFIQNNVAATSGFEMGVAKIAKIGYQRVLADTGRMVKEIISNIGFVLNRGRNEWARGMKHNSVGEETVSQAMRNLNSLVTGRLYSDAGIQSRFAEKLTEANAGVRGKKNKSAIRNVLGIINYHSGKPIYNFADAVADAVISKPDQMMTRPLWKGTFDLAFEKETGKAFPADGFERIAANDQAFMSEYESALKIATAKADDIAIEAGASSGLFTGITRGKDYKSANSGLEYTAKYLFANFNGYMANFLNFEYTAFRKGLNAAMDNGEITRKEGRQLMAAVVTRMTLYTFLGSVITKGALSILLGLLGVTDDEEEDKGSKTKAFMRSVVQTGLALLVGRNFGNAFKAIQNLIIEDVNEKYLDVLRDGEYDKYKNSLAYTVSLKKKSYEDPKVEQAISTFSGPFGKLLNSANAALKVGDDFFNPSKTAAGREKQRKRKLKLIFSDIPSTLGMNPFANEVEKEFNKALYKDVGTGKFAKPSKTSINDLKEFAPDLYNELKQIEDELKDLEVDID